MADDNSTKELLDQLKKVQKEMKEAREEAAGWGESLAEAGKKFVDSINPAVSVKKKINELEKTALSLKDKELDILKELESLQGQAKVDKENELKDNLANQKLLKNQLESEQKKLSVMMIAYDIVSKLVDAYDKYDKLLADNAVKQGISRVESEKQAVIMQRVVASSTNLVVNLQEALESVAELNNNLGVMAAEYMPQVAERAAQLSQSIGISAAESAQFFTTLGEIGNTSLQAQQNMAGVADAAAKAAGVPLGKVIKDVSGASASVRTIFRGNTTELIKQAAELRKIGSSLDQAAKSAESLLNFESSVGAELKASALLGKNINFNQSRRLFFEGKIAEGEKALQAELERVGDIDKLNYFQRKALSELTGKDINELQKISSLKKTQQKIDQENPDLAKERLKLEKELAKVTGSEVEQKKRANELAAIENVAKTRTAILDAQKEQAMLALGKAMKPIMDLVREVQIVFFKLLATIADFGGPAGVVIAGLAGLTIAFFAFKKGVKVVADFLADAMGNAAQKVGEGIGKGLEAIGKGLRNFGRSIRFLVIPPPAIAAIGIITAALLGFSLALIGVGYALKLMGEGLGAAAPALKVVTDMFVSLATIIGGVFLKTLDKVPMLLESVTLNIIKLAAVGPALVATAFGIGSLGFALAALTTELVLFPTSELTKITTQLVAMGGAAAGVALAAASLKELDGVDLPKIDIGGLAAVNAITNSKNDEIKQGLQVVAEKLDVLTGMMAAGKIAVYMDRVKVSKELAEGTLKFGVSGQATNLV